MADRAAFLEKHLGIIIAILTICLMFFIGFSYGRSAKYSLIVVFGMLLISMFIMIFSWVFWPK